MIYKAPKSQKESGRMVGGGKHSEKC